MEQEVMVVLALDHIESMYPNVKIINKINDLDIIYEVGSIKYPYYQLRGKPVTKEQAYDIIAHTDIEFSCIQYRVCVDKKMDIDEILDIMHFSNNWFSHNQFPFLVGWCHPDGTIGVNSIGHKYPDYDEILDDLAQIITTFPYLDFVVAFTIWEELSPSCQEEHFCNKHDINEAFDEFQRRQVRLANQELEEGVVMGYHIHDGTIEILDKEDSYRLLNEYKEKYGKDEMVYHDFYYGSIVPSPVTHEVMNNCIDAIKDETLHEYIQKHLTEDFNNRNGKES